MAILFQLSKYIYIQIFVLLSSNMEIADFRPFIHHFDHFSIRLNFQFDLDLDLDGNLQGPYGAIRRWVGISLWARRHKLALELVQGASLCRNGREFIPLFHSAKHKLVPQGRPSPCTGSHVHALLPRASVTHKINRFRLNC